MNKIKYLYLLLLLFTTPCLSQVEYLQFDKLNNGISTNIVNTIYQDKKGWMWFSTSQGLNLYDGNKLKIYKSNTNEPNSLIGNLIRFVFEDSKGMLWVGTEIGGLNLFNRETENFTFFYDEDNQQNKLIYSANTIAEDKKGDLWIGTNKGLKKFDRASRKFHTYSNNPQISNSLSDNYVRKIYIDNSNIIWIGTNSGLDKFDPQTNTFNRINLFEESISDKSVYEIYGDNKGKVWIGTYSDGIYVYDPITLQFEHLVPDKKDRNSQTVRAILQDNTGNFWIGTRNGLFIYSEKNRTFKHFLHDEKNPLSLCHNSLLSFFKDNRNDIWIGTRGGISYYVNEKQIFRHFSAFPDDKRFLNNSDVYAFLLDSDNEIWVGTDFGGINILNPDRNQFKYIGSLNEKTGKLSSNCIKSIVDDNKGNLWIGTYLGGLNIFNKKSKEFTYYQHNKEKPESLIDDRVWSILCDHNNNMWIGTGKGVDFFNTDKKKFIHPELTEKQVDWLAEDSEYNIWIGTNPEIIILNRSGKIVSKFSVDTRTRGFCEDHLNRVWLATEKKGIILVDKYNGRIIKSYGEDQGLSSNSAFSITEDNQGSLWIGTANGLSRVDTKENTIRKFAKEDGTLLTHYNYGASLKLPSGELLFGGYDGFIIFDPQKIKSYDYLPPVILTELKINNQKVVIGAKKSPLATQISDTKSIVLKHTQNFLTFEYIALNYASPNNVSYKYKMEGIDDNWIEVGNKREAIYTDLQPGNYTFTVAATNNNNQWDDTITSLKIKITPPLYKTLIFKAFIVFLFIVIILLLIYYRTKRVKLINAELERLVYQKTKDLQQIAVQLEESQSEVMAQNEEIEKQNDYLKELNDKVGYQNRTLEKYSTDLELKVKERTFQLEEALKKAEESDKLKSAILANMSHEIRTPMNTIIGLTNLLLTEDISKEDKTLFTQTIRKNSDTLLHLINGVLDLSVIESGKLALSKTPVNITHFLWELHQVFTTEKEWLEKNHIEFKLKIPPSELLIETDPLRVGQIIKNLLHNAFKFTEQGSVELGYATSVNDIILYVKDTGIGIPLTKQNIIFDSFVQLEENTSKSNGNGVGLGLSICWKLSQLLGGKLWVISDLNEGSTFYLSLPINRNQNQPKFLNNESQLN